MDITIYEVVSPDQVQEYLGCRFKIHHDGMILTNGFFYVTPSVAQRWAIHYAKKHFPGVRLPDSVHVQDYSNTELIV